MQPSEEKKLYQSIFENASDGLIVTDLETQLVVEANPAACAMHGYHIPGIHWPAPVKDRTPRQSPIVYGLPSGSPEAWEL